jgi:hypothetical protein
MANNEIRVWTPDCQGRLAPGTLIPPTEWSEWAITRVGRFEDPLVGVALIDGREQIVRCTITPNAIEWKTV